VEPAEKLLQRILAERRAKWERAELPGVEGKRDNLWTAKLRKKYSEPESPEIINLPGIPSTWLWVRIDTLADIKGGITKDSQRKIPKSLSLPYLRVANVQRGYLDLSEMKYIEVPAGEAEDLLLEPGDILFNEGGDRDKLGRGWIWEGQIKKCTYQNHVFRARLFLREISGKFISWFGNNYGQHYFIAKGKQTTNLASINKTMLSAFPVPLPPLSEQQYIVQEVERRLSEIRQLDEMVETNLNRAEHLRQSILKKAFSGKLVPQDPDDEPAAILLERIRLQKEKGKARGKIEKPNKYA
jgi:type I restriction enzyme, S subunit